MTSLHFLRQLHDSPWKGCVTEVGIGVSWLHDVLSQPGASATLLSGKIPYCKEAQGHDHRSVSEEAADSLSRRMLTDSMRLVGHNDKIPVFGLAFTGSHKGVAENGQTHGWISLGTLHSGKGAHYTAHFWMPACLSRAQAADRVSATISWFLTSTLLDYPWSDVTLPRDVNVDVLKGPSVTLKDQLIRLSPNNPIFFQGIEGPRRAVDAIRKGGRVYPGSFNPPTTAHVTLGRDAMFVLGVDNCRKGRISFVDLQHRIRMATEVLNLPLLVTEGNPKFIDLDEMLKRLGSPGVQYIVGTDTFNRMLTDDAPKAFADMYQSGFLVYVRDRDTVTPTTAVDYAVAESERSGSSSEVRAGNMQLVDPRIAKYIEENSLYDHRAKSTSSNN